MGCSVVLQGSLAEEAAWAPSKDISQKLKSRAVVQAPGTPHTSWHHMLFVVGVGAGRTYLSGIHAFGHHAKPPDVLLMHLGFPGIQSGAGDSLFPLPCVALLWAFLDLV